MVEEIGTILKIEKGSASAKLYITADKIFSDLKIGDSICVNGICLTAVFIEKNVFAVDVMHETLSRTSLNDLKKGSHVNLERAMAADGRFGGHIVSGHIDGTGILLSKKSDDIAVWLKIGSDTNILKYIVEKGSVALDGVSLTVAKVNDSSFFVSIIPHTAEETILLSKKVKDKINIECDIIGKYVEKLMNFKDTTNSKITKNFLSENGFI